jgi:hypothetical protein
MCTKWDCHHPLNESNVPQRVPCIPPTTTKGARDASTSQALDMFFFFLFFIVTNDYLQIYYERPPLPTTTYNDDGAANCHHLHHHLDSTTLLMCPTRRSGHLVYHQQPGHQHLEQYMWGLRHRCVSSIQLILSDVIPLDTSSAPQTPSRYYSALKRPTRIV